MHKSSQTEEAERKWKVHSPVDSEGATERPEKQRLQNAGCCIHKDGEDLW